MRRNPADWNSITLANDLTLLLGWRPGPKKLTAERLETNSDVADELWVLCRTTLDRLGTLAARPYEEPSILEKGEEFFTLDLEDLPFTPQLRSRDTIPLTVAYTDSERDEEQRQVADLINLIQRAATLEPLSAGQARDGRFLFYAVVTADENGSPITFVKQSSRIRVARPGRLVAIYADRLSRVEQPVFAFSDDFDLVLAGTDLAVLRAEAYLSLFTDIEVLRNAVPGLVTRLSQQINIDIPDSSLTVLEERCALKPSFAKRLRRLAHQPWLDSVTPDALRKEMAALPGLPAGVIVEDGSLTVTEEGVGVLLGLIEQVYWVGPFDQQLRQAQAYLTVTSRGRPQ
ncbi:MAG: hypothetical protein ACRDS9_10870 [Pseudonocardiaceae bacterium]